jgi:hypothetical protein
MDFIITGLKYIAIVLTFGAYHLYIADTQWKLQQEIRRIEIETFTEILKEMNTQLNKKS